MKNIYEYIANKFRYYLVSEIKHMKQKKLKKLIWDISKQTKMPPVPNKNNMWENISYVIGNSNTDIQTKESSSYTFFEKLIMQFKINFRYTIAFLLTIILINPIYDKFNQNKIIKTNSGERLSFILPDNSKITLNAQSSISYKNTFNIKDRILELDGEAYFEIEKNPLPFIVQTDHGNIKVLGTKFNVMNRKNEFEVGVNEGQVEISNQIAIIQLKDKQCIMDLENFNDKNIINIPYPNYPGWINQKLYCNQKSLKTICLEIERLFNIKIKFSNPNLKNITVTGVIDISNLKTMLNTVSLLTQHKFKFEGGSYFII